MQIITRPRQAHTAQFFSLVGAVDSTSGKKVFVSVLVIGLGPASDCGKGVSFPGRGSCSLVSVSGTLSPGGGDPVVNGRTVVLLAVERETLVHREDYGKGCQ